MKTTSPRTTAKNPGSFNARYHLKILKALLISTNGFVLFMYASLFFIFADMPFNAMDELKVMASSLGWATGFGMGFSFLLFAGDGIIYLLRKRKQAKPSIQSGPSIQTNYPDATPLLLKRSYASMIGPEMHNN